MDSGTAAPERSLQRRSEWLSVTGILHPVGKYYIARESRTQLDRNWSTYVFWPNTVQIDSLSHSFADIRDWTLTLEFAITDARSSQEAKSPVSYRPIDPLHCQNKSESPGPTLDYDCLVPHAHCRDNTLSLIKGHPPAYYPYYICEKFRHYNLFLLLLFYTSLLLFEIYILYPTLCLVRLPPKIWFVRQIWF